ncbi:MAG: hypothetical protein JWP87_4736 [Labilithrix sp.]|nr:hypothetical protein [Labilithrix sp.]
MLFCPPMTRPWFLLAPLLLASALSAGDAGAADTSIALGEVAVPPASTGVDRVAFRSAAEGELRGVDASKIRARKTKRTVVVSMAVSASTQSPFGCTVNALLRDAKTGNMLAIIEGSARVEGDANVELRKQVLRRAVRNAVSQIPDALAGN